MKKIKKSIYNRFALLSEYIIQKINSLFKENGRILMYHHVSDESLDVLPTCICTTLHFKKTLMEYKEKGYEFISMSEVDDYIKSGKKFIIITFDDGCKDIITNAYPFLKENRFPFIIYITNNLIDKPGYMSKDDIINLSTDNLCTIGHHTKSHTALIDTYDYQDELAIGKEELEKQIGGKIDYFAYPYGKINMVGFRAIRKVSKMGYKNAVGTIDTPISRFTRLFVYYLPRMVV